MTNMEIYYKSFELFGNNSIKSEILRLQLEEDNSVVSENFKKMVEAEILNTKI